MGLGRPGFVRVRAGLFRLRCARGKGVHVCLAYDYRCTLPYLARNSGVVCHNGLGDSQSRCIPVFERGLEARNIPRTRNASNDELACLIFGCTSERTPIMIQCIVYPARALHRFLYMFRLNPCPKAAVQCVASAFRLCSAPATQLPTMSHYPTFQTRGSEVLTAQGRGLQLRCGVVGRGMQSHKNQPRP
jgi:hypothetical protein